MDDDPRAATRRLSAGCGLWFAVEFLAGLVGMALAALAMQAKQPQWVVPVVLFGPAVLVAILFGIFFLPRLIRQAREAARNAPSPESVAAAADGSATPAVRPPFEIPVTEVDASVPAVPIVPTRPGVVLAHRLERAEMPFGCKFGCAVFAALFWNGIVSIFVWNLISGWNRMGGFRWFFAAFLTPFVLVGIGLIVAVFVAAARWFVSVLVGRIEVELSDHPVVLGRAVRIHIAQRGPFALARVEARLVCIEEASYVAGTSRSTATKEVAQHLLIDPEQSPDGGRLPQDFGFTVPADSMHSFQAANNKIKWTVRVAGRVLGVSFRDDYTVVVIPGDSP